MRTGGLLAPVTGHWAHGMHTCMHGWLHGGYRAFNCSVDLSWTRACPATAAWLGLRLPGLELPAMPRCLYPRMHACMQGIKWAAPVWMHDIAFRPETFSPPSPAVSCQRRAGGR